MERTFEVITLSVVSVWRLRLCGNNISQSTKLISSEHPCLTKWSITADPSVPVPTTLTFLNHSLIPLLMAFPLREVMNSNSTTSTDNS